MTSEVPQTCAMVNSLSPGFEIVTSMRYDESLPSHDRELYIPKLHRDRLLRSASQLGWEAFKAENLPWLASLASFSTFVNEHVQAWFKCHPEHDKPSLKIRIAANCLGIPTLTISAVAPVDREALHPDRLDVLLLNCTSRLHPFGCFHPPDADLWNIWIDTEYTTQCPHSTIKSNQRQVYDKARERAGLGDYATSADVLLVNEAGNIMETSISTIYVVRNGMWVTPTLASGCQAGTTRRWALERGWCLEEDVPASNVVNVDCVVSNGVRGFAVGRIHGIRMRHAATNSDNRVN